MRIVEYRPRHAPLLARLWNASDAAWPVGLVRLRPKTGADWREGERQIDSVGRFVALEDGRAIGYVRLFEWFESSDAAYVQWLNVDPAYHGRGIGKALLGKALDRTMALGYPRLDLHTWPGNDKAMPLYKRMGYMWVPGSHAYLQNYLPLILAYEPARPFFARNDWYASLKRDLSRDHDEDRLHGIDVFLYRFAASRRTIEATIDRSARGITAFEDSEVRVDAWIPDGTLVEGLDGVIHWSVRNKTRALASVAIEATGPPGLRVKSPDPFELRPGEVRELKGTVSIPDAFPDSPAEWASPAIESAFVVGGRVIRVRSGFRPKTPLELRWDSDLPRLPAPGRRDLVLAVRNQCGRPIRGHLEIKADRLRPSPSRVPLRLAKGGIRRVKVRLVNDRRENQAAKVRVRFASREVHAVKTLPLACLEPGGSVAYADRKDWILESSGLRVVSSGLGSAAAIFLPDGTKLCEGYLYAGPPFIPNDAWQHRWEGRIETTAGSPTVVRTFRSRRRPGMVLEQRWRCLGDRLLEVRAAIENRGPEPWSAAASFGFSPGDDFFEVTVPTPDGPATEAIMEFEWPDERHDVPLDRIVSEGWLHAGNETGGYGVVWEPPVARKGLELTAWSIPQIRTPERRVAPGTREEFLKVWVVLSPDWRDARTVWAQVSGTRPATVEARSGALRLETTPGTILAVPAADVSLTLRNLRRRPTRGRLRLETPAGLAARPARWSIRSLDLSREVRLRTRFRATRSFAGAVTAAFDDDKGTQTWTLPVAGMPSRGSVQFTGPRTARRVDNGLLSFAVAPAHAASLVSLRAGGHEYLVSSYPKPGSFAWFRPFFGGVQPSLFQDDWPGDLFRERFRIREARRGAWRGLRLSTRTSKSSLPEGVRVAVEYLTRPRSPLLVAALEVSNETRERQTFTAAFWMFLGLDGKARSEVSFERLRPRTWRGTERVGWSRADGGFAVFHAPRAPKAVAICAGAPHGLEVFGLRRLGHHGSVQGELALRPGETGTVLAALAVVSPGDAPAYRALRGLSIDALQATRAK